MTSRLFAKLLGLLLLLLVLQVAAMELVFVPILAGKVPELPPGKTFFLLGSQLIWAGLIALLCVLPFALWAARRISARFERVAAFARRIADGDLSARLDLPDEFDLHTIGSALNQTAERLGERFAELDSRRQELAAMLDSMQEAVVAITPEGLVRWSNAAMQRIAGTQIRVGRALAHSVRDPEMLACVKAALDLRETRSCRSSSLAPGRIFEINAAPLPSGGDLLIRAAIVGDSVVMEVENPGQLAEPVPQATQLGLANIRERLRLVYNGRASFELKNRDGRVAATVAIPKAV